MITIPRIPFIPAYKRRSMGRQESSGRKAAFVHGREISKYLRDNIGMMNGSLKSEFYVKSIAHDFPSLVQITKTVFYGPNFTRHSLPAELHCIFTA